MCFRIKDNYEYCDEGERDSPMQCTHGRNIPSAEYVYGRNEV